MKGTHTLLRLAEHAALAKVRLAGSVLDIGGDTHAAYRDIIKGSFTTHTVNLDRGTSPDFFHDLEEALPLEGRSYDNVIMINVLEHIYHAQALLAEAVRVTHPGGTIVVVVPFLFPIHPDPHDYWRFSGETLTRMFNDAGIRVLTHTSLGSGVFAARYVMLDRLMPAPLRLISSYTLQHLVAPLDRGFVMLARLFGKKYQPEDYALGYCVTGITSIQV